MNGIPAPQYVSTRTEIIIGIVFTIIGGFSFLLAGIVGLAKDGLTSGALPLVIAVALFVVTAFLIRAEQKDDSKNAELLSNFTADLADHYGVIFTTRPDMSREPQTLTVIANGQTLVLTLAFADGRGALYGSDNNDEYRKVSESYSEV